MFVYSGNTPVLESYVSTGRPGFDTPTGTFYVSLMYEYDDMEGVLGGEYYNVPQVPDVLYFTGQGHAIHGAYWHNNFGAVMSHGCVNLPMDVADWLYSYAYLGMRIVIHY
jgi:lipoprotein-anchoring transpeptidase ErfK/SrfK